MRRIFGSGLAWCCLASVCLGGGGPPVRLDWGVVDTTSVEQQAKSRAIRSASKPTVIQQKNSRGGAPWLVQFNNVIQEEWKSKMVKAGAELKGYIPENAFLIEATPAVVAKIGAMTNVTWVGEYLPSYKKAKPVRQMLANGVEETREYSILLFQADDRVRISRAIAELKGAFVTVVEALPDRGLVRARLSSSAIETISDWGEVEWIEPYVPPKLFNDVSVRTNKMNVSNVWSTLGLTGAGQTIAVCDTGLDTGNTSTLHRDFTNRVMWTQALGRTGNWSDPHSHGTHVAGSVLGNGTSSTGRYKGVAYEANLVFQSVLDSSGGLGGLPADLTTLFRAAFTNGARIHSDSWGSATNGVYTTYSRDLDMFVWSNKTMLILMAAGNEGIDANSDGVVDADSMSSPGTAKNCLTVGAAENYRTISSTWGASWPSDFPVDPIYSDNLSQPDSPQGMAAFSSRGPCDDGRIKPDIVAPGTYVISTRSRASTNTGWATVSANTNYLYMGGTSMATPLTAGAAGLARQWVTTTGGITNPSAALLKALLINGARNMAPGQYGTGATQEIPTSRPNNVQGYGHVDLYNTLKPSTNQFMNLYDTNSLSTGQSNTFSFTVSTASTNKFVMTMAYSDYWATSSAEKKLVNDLDLTVRKPSGTLLYANGSTTLDSTNNVEMIEFAADEVGTYTVQVAARTVPFGTNQAYAMVVRGPMADEPPVAPSSIWASATNSVDFTAAWSAVSGAASYQLDVATHGSFSGGGGAGATLIDEDFSSFSDWTDSGTAIDTTNAHYGAASPCRGLGTGATLTSPRVNSPTQMTFYVDSSSGGNGKITTNYYSLDDGVSWSPLGSFIVSTVGATVTQVLTSSPNLSASTNVKFRFVSAFSTWYLDDVKVTGGAGTPSYVEGYSNRAVASTSQSVTGLTSGATYYFRARAVNAAGSSLNSPTGSVITTGGISGTPPTLNSIAAQSATVNEDFEYTVTATSTEGDPILSYACTSVVSADAWDLDRESGYFNFLPQSAQIGANVFSFTATDKDGVSSPVAMTVTVSAASTPPTVSFGSSRVYAEEGGSTVFLPVTLSFAADATVQVAIAGTALPNGTDFNCSTTIQFSASGSASSNWVLSVMDDSLAEGPESASLRLNPVSGATLGAIPQAVFFIRDNDAFSIMAGNLTSGTYQQYEDSGERILQALCPDVVLLQEFLMTNGVTIRAWVNEHFGSNFYYYVESTNGDSAVQLPNGIISRWPITASNEWEDVNISNRDFAWAKIDLPGSRDLYAVSVHLKADSGSESERTAEARVLTNNVTTNGWLTNGYVVIGGDFNLQNRSETALSVLTSKVLSDARQPADQVGDKDTNSGRDNPYDLVLPSTNLNARHRAFTCYGYTFTNGMIFDTRITWANGLPPPALTNDSGAANMQHMAVLKVFELEDYLEAPSSLAATPAGRTQMDLSWNPNSAGDSVLVAWNTTGTFATPTGSSPGVGGTFAGGTVLYKGTATSASHSGLSGCSSYFYRAWSYLDTNYSAGVDASAITLGPDAPLAVWAIATNNTHFTAAWSAVDGIVDYRLDVSEDESFGALAAASDLFISEYIEGASNEKYIEIFNGTGLSVDLSGYSLLLVANGASTPTASNVLSGTLENGGVAVYKNTSSTNAIGAVSTSINFNGDDAVALWRRSSSSWVDIIGRMGEDPGTAWTDGSFSTLDQTLVRKSTVSGGVTNNPVSRFPTLGTEWDSYGMSNEGYLGSHTFDGGGSRSSTVAGYSNRMVSGVTSFSVTGLTSGVTYYFRVRAVDGTCESDHSSTGQVTTRAQENQNITAFMPTNGSVYFTTNSVSLSATASSGLVVTFAVGSGPAILSGGTNLTFTGEGSVMIVASQAGNANWNPAPNVTNTLTTVKATANVVLNGLAQTYNGTARTVTATTTPDGLTVSVTYGGLETAPTGVGSYAVTGTVSDALYQGSAQGTLVVSKADPSVTVWPTASAILYGQTLASSTLSGGSATPAGAFAFTSPSAIPGGGATAQIVIYTPSDTVNYNTLESTVSVTVNPVALTVTADAQIKPFGSVNPVLTVQYIGFVLGQTAADLATEPTASTGVNETTPVGINANAITVSGGASANYTFTYVAGDFTVTEAIESGTVASNDVDVTFGPLKDGGNYDLLYRPSLSTGDWTVVDTRTGLGEETATLTHEGGGTNRIGYYRVEGETGPSAQVWGYAKMTKPGNYKLVMVGVPFVTEDQTLNSLMNPLEFKGHHNNPGLADQVMVWNAGSQSYLNLALYDLRPYGEEYASQTGWKAFAGFGPTSSYMNPILPAGSAVWIRGTTPQDTQVTMAGEVVMDVAITNPVVSGLQLVSNPFSERTSVFDMDIHVHATGHHNNPGLADQIMVWDAGSQSYLNLALYDLRPYGEEYASLTGWKSFTGFGSKTPYINPILEPGRGFWLKAVNGSFEWAKTNQYLNHLQ